MERRELGAERLRMRWAELGEQSRMGGISDHGLRSELGGLRREWPGGDVAADYGAVSKAKATSSPGRFLQKAKRQRTTTKAQLRHITMAEEGVVG